MPKYRRTHHIVVTVKTFAKTTDKTAKDAVKNWINRGDGIDLSTGETIGYVKKVGLAHGIIR